VSKRCQNRFAFTDNDTPKIYSIKGNVLKQHTTFVARKVLYISHYNEFVCFLRISENFMQHSVYVQSTSCPLAPCCSDRQIKVGGSPQYSGYQVACPAFSPQPTQHQHPNFRRINFVVLFEHLCGRSTRQNVSYSVATFASRWRITKFRRLTHLLITFTSHICSSLNL
jgi:hypothetical protein